MDTLFLFTKHINNEGCLCLKLDAEGKTHTPPAQRSFTDIQMLQQDCTTIVIERCAHASLLTLELPWLPDRKARVAIPYALEDKLAQSVDELHFAFDKARYQNNHYLITAISKQRMHYIMNLLTEKEIEFTAITLDWFALEPEELCISEDDLLVNSDDFKGELSGDLADIYIKKHPLHAPLIFTDSLIKVELDSAKRQETSYEWIARRILNAKLMNLCQGEMQHGSKSDWIKKGYQLAGALFCFWLVSLILVNGINLYFLNKQTAQIDQQIAEIYHSFFPDAKQVISPKFRIMQLLKSNNNEGQTRFWFLLNQFSKVMDSKQFTLEQFRYQNKTLSVTLISPDFAKLEKLENQLKASQLNVKQTQASTHEQQVVATLELS
ncbi:type II secretion system protein GspL [Legionella saoudiensis]|uniref:type II secretion system protein GspL n=1 Tax=Legionella saoudiensis TaxID=1750561 RepID=UPI000731D01B|nr:type II secretion system protein GspL [Legionella saoudiensis]